MEQSAKWWGDHQAIESIQSKFGQTLETDTTRPILVNRK